MKRSYLIIGIIALITFLAIFTNPNQERHKEVVKLKLHSLMQKSIEEKSNETKNKYTNAGQAFGTMLGEVFIDQVIDNLVSSDNYVLFSITKISWEGETRTIGFGAFDRVYLSGKIDEAFEKDFLNKNKY